MLASVAATSQSVAGVLWYQGESEANVADALEYTARMRKLVAASRRDLNLPGLPWMIVQIGRIFGDTADPAPWNSIQEQQRVLSDKIRFLETVPAVDLAMDDFIHISASACPKLASRLARAADRMVYGNKQEAPAPRLHHVSPAVRRLSVSIDVEFSHVVGKLRSTGDATGFKFVAPGGQIADLVYKTELLGSKVRLHVTTLPPPELRLSYGYGRAPVCNIIDSRGMALPAFHGIEVGDTKLRATTPFVTHWNVAPVIAPTGPLDRISPPNVRTLRPVVKTYPETGFINEHETWQKNAGHGFFHARLELGEPMKLQFLMGYDGPFRLWVNARPLFTNMHGTNPCFADESAKVISLPAGSHDITVGMDLNDGRAWGFFLRFVRRDVSKTRLLSGDYAKPSYGL